MAAAAQPKSVLVPVYLVSHRNSIMRLLGGSSNEESTHGASRLGLGKKGLECLKFARDELVLPHDTLVVLLVHPPAASDSSERLQQLEEKMQRSLRQALCLHIDVLAARHIRVDVAVRLHTDRGQAVLNFARTVQASIVVLFKSRFNLLGAGPSSAGAAEFCEIKPEALAKALPITCKVMVVAGGNVVDSRTGEQVPSSGPVYGVPTVMVSPSNGHADPMPRTPSLTLPAEVLRELYGEVEFPVQEMLQATKNFSETNQIGIGGSGSVYAGTLRGQAVAIKRLHWWAIGASAGGSTRGNFILRQFVMELKVMRKVQHPRLLGLLGVCVCDTELQLVFDFQQNGSLERRLRMEPLLTWQQRLRIAAGAAAGLQYLHSRSPPVIHRDVKSANILLDSQLEAKVADFGFAKIAPESYNSQPFPVSLILGTEGYLAPEYRRTQTITKAIDVFAFGVVLLELVTGHVPYDPRRSFTYLSEHAYRAAMVYNDAHLRLLDPRLSVTSAPYSMQTQVLVLMLGILCVDPAPQERPTMYEVASRLQEFVDMETG